MLAGLPVEGGISGRSCLLKIRMGGLIIPRRLKRSQPNSLQGMTRQGSQRFEASLDEASKFWHSYAAYSLSAFNNSDPAIMANRRGTSRNLGHFGFTKHKHAPHTAISVPPAKERLLLCRRRGAIWPGLSD
jgi:hypothetical protein